MSFTIPLTATTMADAVEQARKHLRNVPDEEYVDVEGSHFFYWKDGRVVFWISAATEASPDLYLFYGYGRGIREVRRESWRVK